MTDVKAACEIGEFAATEVKPCSVLVKKLPDVISLKLGASMDVNNDLALKDINLTYDMQKCSNHPLFLMEACKDNVKCQVSKTMHVDEAICQFKDYGGMFKRDGVLKSKLIVSVDRLTTSELPQQSKVQSSQTMQKKTLPGNSGYFKPNTGSRQKTPDKKSVLKRLEMKQPNLSGLDSESYCASENFEPETSKHKNKKLALPTRSDMPEGSNKVEGDDKSLSQSQPVPKKCVPIQDTMHQEKGRVLPTQISKSSVVAVAVSRGGNLPVRSCWKRHYRQHTNVVHRDADKPKTSLNHRSKEKVKSHDPPTVAASSSHSGGSSGCSHEKQHKLQTKHKETPKQHTSFHSQKAKNKLSSRSGGSTKNKALAQGRSRPHEGKGVKHSSSKKTSSHRGKMSLSSLSKRSHVQKDCEEKPKQSKMKQANVKQLPTDCGIDDWDCNGEASAPENVCDKSSQWSPDFMQQVDVAVVPHTSKSNSSNTGSLDYFQIKEEPTDWGTDDWDCIGEPSAPENGCDKSSQWSPDFMQQVDVAFVPHTSKSNSSITGSLDYFQIKEEPTDWGTDDWDCIGEPSAPENVCDKSSQWSPDSTQQEMKPCSVLVKKLPHAISLKLGASMSVNNNLTLKDINLTYDIKKRSNHPPFLMVACKDDSKWEARKSMHVDESICQFKDYGGMFERDGVLKSKLIVSVDRLTTSELPQQAKVQSSQTMQKNILPGNSGYFKPNTVSRRKTLDKKSVLKKLLKEKVKSHDPLTAAASSSHSGDSSSCSHEKQHNFQTKHKETRKQHTSFHSQKAKKELSSRSGRSTKNKALAQGRNRPHEGKEVKHSSSKKTSSHRGKMSQSSLSKGSHVQKDCEEKPTQSLDYIQIKKEPTDCGIDDWDCSGEASAPENLCDKSSLWSPDFMQQVDVAVVPHTSKSNSSITGSLDYFQIKEEPTDWGTDDWDCIGEPSAPENVCDESSQWSPDSMQQVDVRVVPHTSKSLDYFQVKELHPASSSNTIRPRLADNVLSGHLFVVDEESSDESDDDKPRRETTCKCPTTEDDVPVIDTVKG